MKKPNFFIVGAPRCGTTSLYQYLRAHPEIFMPARKEPHFFGSDLDDPRRPRSRAEYLALFAEARLEKRVGEASTSYLYSRQAAREIKEFAPEARIIVMLRNPVDMMYSFYNQAYNFWGARYGAAEDLADFESALEAEDERKRGSRLPGNLEAVSYTGDERTRSYHFLFYRDLARYAAQLQRYLDCFGRDNVHAIIFDDLQKTPAQVYRETCAFLEVAEDYQPDFRVYNSQQRFRSKTVARLLRLVPVPVLGAGRNILVRFLGRAASAKLLGLMHGPARPRPLESALRGRLQAEFAAEVEQLSALLGRDVTHWCPRGAPGA